MQDVLEALVELTDAITACERTLVPMIAADKHALTMLDRLVARALAGVEAAERRGCATPAFRQAAARVRRASLAAGAVVDAHRRGGRS